MNALIALFLAVNSPAAAAAADREIVKVNGVPIRQSEVMERLWKRFGDETLEEMIDEILLRQEAKAKGIAASPAEVDARFKRLTAQFSDPKVLANQLEQNGTSVEGVKKDLAEQIAREKLIASARGLAVKEEELKKAFEANKDELGVKEGVRLRHILVKTKKEADDLAARIKAGADFGKLAREKSLAPTGKLTGGDYGIVSRGMLPQEIESVAFSLKENELRVVSTPKGFHILQALERRAAVPAEYAAVKDELRELLMQQKLKSAVPDYIRELRQKAEIKAPGKT